eukprot:TRINITY_DN1753_c0_g1_i3.p1 TRINITY_DN1753_c0_g1~~TRINITY_DN1753_c0_g1_i3.p1  ORF type:complete len:179 (-),score=28.08 TRINITY_DN1753_c0_g1_i3:479-1015(-)
MKSLPLFQPQKKQTSKQNKTNTRINSMLHSVFKRVVWRNRITSLTKIPCRYVGDTHLQPNDELSDDRGALRFFLKVLVAAFAGNFAYDTYKSFQNYTLFHQHDRMKTIWNQVGLETFYAVSRDPDIIKELGRPVKMGAPPPQSKSPLRVNDLDFRVAVILNNHSIFLSRKKKGLYLLF